MGRTVSQSVARVVCLIGVLAVISCSAYVGAGVEPAAAQPPVGAYQEPAPEAPEAGHAAGFVNELLKKRGTTTRVTTRELRAGVVLAPPAASARRSPSPPSQPEQTDEGEQRLPPPDIGPAERAGVASAVDQDVPGILVGLVVAAVLAAVGVVLELSGRRRGREA